MQLKGTSKNQNKMADTADPNEMAYNDQSFCSTLFAKVYVWSTVL